MSHKMFNIFGIVTAAIFEELKFSDLRSNFYQGHFKKIALKTSVGVHFTTC